MGNEAILLVNMGGPDHIGQIRPYLQEIFRDPAILPVPNLCRNSLANLISSRRAGKISERYNHIGGKSPIRKWTESQVRELGRALKTQGKDIVVSYAFRYCSPFIGEAIAGLWQDGFRDITVVPLFPHYTSAMTGSVLKEVDRAANAHGLHFRSIGSFGNSPAILDLWKQYLLDSLSHAGEEARVLFVAHGIPLRNVRRGDPYPSEVEQTARSLGAALPSGTKWSIAYQSKVGPAAWTGPYLEDEMNRLSESSSPLVIMPLSFVSDCLETLYDLDIVAMKEAHSSGIMEVVRVKAFNDDPKFAEALCKLIFEDDNGVIKS